MTSIGSSVAGQFERMWEMLRVTIEQFEPEQWRPSGPAGLVPARWANHALEASEFYLQDQPDRSVFGRRFGVKRDADAADLPDQQQVLDYLAEVSAAYQSKLLSLSDEEYLGPNAFEWAGSTVLEKMLYVLRHNMTHQGELSMLLRIHGAAETEWR
jgi:uncharacterized damage-inducible protein DinB